MTIFVVFRAQTPDRLNERIEREFPHDHMRLQNNEWLISAEMTPIELSNKIGITTDPSETGSAMVFSMRSYYGRATSDIWDWIKTKTEASSG